MKCCLKCNKFAINVGDSTKCFNNDCECHKIMEQIKLAELHLASARQNFDDFLKSNLSDAEETESAMTKTDTGYVYEIRYKQPGKLFIADAITINGVYEKLSEFMSLDKMRETVEGLSVQVGRLAASFAEKKPKKKK